MTAKHADTGEVDLPGPWTDMSMGLTRQNVKNILSFEDGVTVYFDGEPVAVLLSARRYQFLFEAATGVLDS